MSWVRSPLAAPGYRRTRQPKTPDSRVSVIIDISENTVERSAVALPPGWLYSFVPRRGLSNGHLQTLVGNYFPRPLFRVASQAETVEVDPSDGSRVLCHCSWQPEAVRAACLTIVLVHGLEGSSDSQYIQGLAARAWEAGCNVIRMNMRNCGDTDHLTPTLYHSGLSGDVGAVVDNFTKTHGLRQVALVGYSMGGNLVLKLAGEWGNRAPLCGVAAVCPAIDLGAGSDALHDEMEGHGAVRNLDTAHQPGCVTSYRNFISIQANLHAFQLIPALSITVARHSCACRPSLHPRERCG